MHGTHRTLPFFSRLDDGRVVERERPGSTALVAGSAQAHPKGGDTLLLDLASHALDGPPGGTILVGAGGTRTTIEPPSGGGLGLIGLQCPPGTAAVASSVQCQTLWPDDRRRGGMLAWSADRHGGSVALFRDETVDGAETLSAVAGTLLDAALRALSLPTRPCLSPTVWFPDGVFLHRVAKLLQRRGGACTRRRLSWDSLSVLYPLNDTGEPLSPCMMRLLRQRFHAANTWASLRLGVAVLPAAAPAILPGLTPQVAGWLDDGAFARWVLSRVSDVPSTIEWLCGHVDQGLADHLAIALGDVHSPSPATP